jgi:hypothetical protein
LLPHGVRHLFRHGALNLLERARRYAICAIGAELCKTEAGIVRLREINFAQALERSAPTPILLLSILPCILLLPSLLLPKVHVQIFEPHLLKILHATPSSSPSSSSSSSASPPTTPRPPARRPPLSSSAPRRLRQKKKEPRDKDAALEMVIEHLTAQLRPRGS